MDSSPTTARITINRRPNNQVDVSTNMPTLRKPTEGGTIHIIFPLLGNLDIFCRKEDNVDRAIKEAISCFILASEKFGKGVTGELNSLGWGAVQSPSWRKQKAKIGRSSTTFNREVETQLRSAMHSTTTRALQLQD